MVFFMYTRSLFSLFISAHKCMYSSDFKFELLTNRPGYRACCALCITLCGGTGCCGHTAAATGCAGIVVAGMSTLGTAAACCVCRGRVDGTKDKRRLIFLCSVRGCFWFFLSTVFSVHTLPGFFAYSVSLVFILIYTHAFPSPHSEEHPARAHCVEAVAKKRGIYTKTRRKEICCDVPYKSRHGV